MSVPIDHFLDITSDVCPITFVRTKLLIEKMKSGEVLEVRLTKGEPLENVPRSVSEEGHEVLSLEPDGNSSGHPSVYVLRLRKA
ncbi:MAG: sulfurtransferase TusA family protein [Proteobacteria bacterium]|nr:sulfurtransferase TusA family protein [Pseudomonadota bacterium]